MRLPMPVSQVLGEQFEQVGRHSPTSVTARMIAPRCLCRTEAPRKRRATAAELGLGLGASRAEPTSLAPGPGWEDTGWRGCRREGSAAGQEQLSWPPRGTEFLPAVDEACVPGPPRDLPSPGVEEWARVGLPCRRHDGRAKEASQPAFFGKARPRGRPAVFVAPL